ncbi:hypothetical protein ACLOJK_018741, partial [Asimina triloba]
TEFRCSIFPMEPPSTHRRRVENRQIHADHLLHLARQISDLQTASSRSSLQMAISSPLAIMGSNDRIFINDVHSDRKPSTASTSRTQPQQWAIPDPDREHRPLPFGRSTSPSMTATMESISMDETNMKWAAPLESADINVSIIAINRKPSAPLQAKPRSEILGQKSSSTVFSASSRSSKSEQQGASVPHH